MKTPSLLVSSKTESTIEPVPEGLHHGVLTSIYDLGTLFSEKFDIAQRKLVMTFELPDLAPLYVERDGKRVQLPRVVSLRLTRSLNEKAKLRALLESWRGKRFTASEMQSLDLGKLLGTPAWVQILHEVKTDGKTFANISNLLPIPKGTPKPVASSALVLFSVDQLEAPSDLEQAGLPPWIAELVKTSREFERLVARATKQAPGTVLPPHWVSRSPHWGVVNLEQFVATFG